MVISGVDSSKNPYPIRVDSSGRPYVILDDGSGNTMPAGDATARPIYVKLTDGVHDVDITSSNKILTQVFGLYPDNTNQMPSGDTTARPIFIKLTDGTNDALFEADDADIAGSQNTIVVINLNYVYDAANTKWVRMTQP